MVRRIGRAAALPLVGLSKERRRIEDAVRRGDSILMLGPAGSGKTALIKSIAAATPGAVYVEYSRVLHDMLAKLTTALIEAHHPRLTTLVRNGDSPAQWAGGQTSVHLRGVLWSGLESSPCLLILDDIERSSFQAYRFFQRVYFSRGMRMIAIARDPVRLGEIRRLFWDPRQTIQMAPLSELEASTLFELAADHFGLREFDLDDFRPRVLDNAKGNPGQIVEMCRMAREPQYRSGKHILFAPLRIDLMARYLA
jgi:energy-coupling factor transporter ATP-binding protein EcfA2